MAGAPTKKRRTKAEQRAETLEQIIDAAEYLFSKRGFDGVTLRDVAQRVGIHTTLLHYYFKDKTALFRTVFERRAGVTSSLRMAALEAYEAEAGDHPTVEGALHAFLDTDLDLYREGGEGWMNYAAFGARISNTPEGAALMDEYFDPVVLKLVGILKRALPDYSEEDIFWGYHFVTGALMNTLAHTGRIDRLSGGICHSDDFHAVKKRMAKFMAAGFQSLKG
ncbi:MAG: TetR/AcrR family transcriptional regulator [Sphingomonas sp.]